MYGLILLSHSLTKSFAGPPTFNYCMTTFDFSQKFQIWVAKQQTAVVCCVGGGSMCR